MAHHQRTKPFSPRFFGRCHALDMPGLQRPLSCLENARNDGRVRDRSPAVEYDDAPPAARVFPIFFREVTSVRVKHETANLCQHIRANLAVGEEACLEHTHRMPGEPPAARALKMGSIDTKATPSGW